MLRNGHLGKSQKSSTGWIPEYLKKVYELTLIIIFVILTVKWQSRLKMKISKTLGIQPIHSMVINNSYIISHMNYM